jgi:hypothetical protein
LLCGNAAQLGHLKKDALQFLSKCFDGQPAEENTIPLFLSSPGDGKSLQFISNSEGFFSSVHARETRSA